MVFLHKFISKYMWSVEMDLGLGSMYPSDTWRFQRVVCATTVCISPSRLFLSSRCPEPRTSITRTYKIAFNLACILQIFQLAGCYLFSQSRVRWEENHKTCTSHIGIIIFTDKMGVFTMGTLNLGKVHEKNRMCTAVSRTFAIFGQRHKQTPLCPDVNQDVGQTDS